MACFVFEELAGEMATVDRDHDFPGAALRQGIETAQEDALLVEDDDLLVHHVDLDDGVQDGAQVGQVLLVRWLALQGVAGVAYEQHDLTPLTAASVSSGSIDLTRLVVQGAHIQIERRAYPRWSAKVR